MATLERITGTNPDGSTFDLRETASGEYTVNICLNGETLEKRTTARIKAIEFLNLCRWAD